MKRISTGAVYLPAIDFEDYEAILLCSTNQIEWR